MRKFLLTTSILTALTAPGWAQDNSESGPETVIVTATRLPTPESQIASSVTVIDAATIEAQQQRSLPDVLRAVPGLSITQTGGAGGQTSIFMRGTDSNHTKVLLDGIDISDPSTPKGTADLGKLLSGDIARVEVLRGPQSGLYGSDAIGGVVNIITKAGEGPFALSGTMEGGSFDTFNQTVTASGSDDGLSGYASVQHYHSGATPVTPLDLLLPGEKRNDDYYDNVTGTVKLGYDVLPGFDLGFIGRASDSAERITSDASDPVTFASFPSPTQSRLNVQQYETRATAHLVTGILEQTLGVAYGATTTSDFDPNNGPLPNAGDRVKIDWQGNVGLGFGTLVLGAETARDAIHLPISAGVTTNAGYGELQVAEGDFAASGSVRYDNNSRYGSHVTWHVAPTFTIASTGTKLNFTAGTGFKAPSLEQLFQSFPPFFFANPNLKPETSTGFDAGVEQELSGGLKAGVTGFYNDIKNLIETDPVTFSTYANVDRATTKGFETFLAWAIRPDLSLRADYTYTEAWDDSTHLQLIRIPRNKASLTADWQAMPDLTLDATVVYSGPQFDGNRDFTISRLVMPGTTLVNIAASYRLTDQFSLFGRVENALDTRYQSPDGFLRPRIGAFAGVKASL